MAKDSLMSILIFICISLLETSNDLFPFHSYTDFEGELTPDINLAELGLRNEVMKKMEGRITKFERSRPTNINNEISVFDDEFKQSNNDDKETK